MDRPRRVGTRYKHAGHVPQSPLLLIKGECLTELGDYTSRNYELGVPMGTYIRDKCSHAVLHELDLVH